MYIANFVFRLLLDLPVVFQSFSGFACRGVFYELVKGWNANLADFLHSSKGLKPFSVTPLMVNDDGKFRIIYRRFKAPSMGYVAFKVFDDKLSEVFKSLLLRGLDEIRLSEISTRIVETSVLTLSFGELSSKARPVKSFSLWFRSPCFFRRTPQVMLKAYPSRFGRGFSLAKSQFRFHPLPEPILLARSLARLWRAFYGGGLKLESFLGWVEAGGLVVSGFPSGIRTVRVYEHPTSNKWVSGFIGKVHFNLPGDLYDKSCAKTLDTLLRFSEYSHVGGGRTAGFGMVEYKPLEYED